MTFKAHRQSQRFLELPEGKIAYIDAGQSEEVVVLIHGVPTSSWLYRHIVPILVAKGFRVIAPDLLGFGNSSKPDGYAIYHEEKQGQRIRTLMTHLGIQSWTQVCHDAGGMWTWEMLKQSAQGVKRLVILNTILLESGFYPPLRFEPGAWAKFYTRMYKFPLTRSFMINATLNNGISKNVQLSAQDKEGYKIPMQEGTHKALYYFFTQTCNALSNYEAVLQSLEIPVMVIWGEQDKILRWQPQAEKVTNLLSIQPENIHLLSDADHFIPEEKPMEIAQWIATFIAR